MNAVVPYLKAYAALIGAVCTALLGVYAADTEVGRVLTVVSVIATAVATWAVPNLDPKARHQAESVQPPRRNEGGWVVFPVPEFTAIFRGKLSARDLEKRIGDPFRDSRDR